MEIVAWSYDVARDQAPSLERLKTLVHRSAAAGYNALALYLEHRFAYPSAPWAAGLGCVTPQMIRALIPVARNAKVRLIPMLATLGHMEGFIRAEGGQWLAEGVVARSSGESSTRHAGGLLSLQICPSRAECREFARGLIRDAMDAFDDEWVHLGGDETRQLGHCLSCAARVAEAGMAGLYGEYFGDLCRWVLGRGRRPCLWGDMLLAMPQAMTHIPRETVIFDWQYDEGPSESSRVFLDAGFDVVCCPALHTFDSAWCFLEMSQRNIDAHASAVRSRSSLATEGAGSAEDRACGPGRNARALGVCVTTWEFTFFSTLESVLPLVFAAGRRLSREELWGDAVTAEGGAAYLAAAKLLGGEIPAAAPLLAPGTWRLLRDRLAMRGNPFLLWREWREEACGPAGDALLALCDRLDQIAGEALAQVRDDENGREASGESAFASLPGPVLLHRSAVQFVREVERAAAFYHARKLDDAEGTLYEAELILRNLVAWLEHVEASGGSVSDVARLEQVCEYVKRVARRIAALRPAPTEGYLPSFDQITQPGYLPGHQAGWRAE